MNWYTTVTNDLSTLPDFIVHFERELSQARYEVSIKGNVEKNLSTLPGITEHRFNQLQEIEAVLNYLNIKLRKIKSTSFKKFLENYPRALTSRDAERYAESETDVIEMELLVNEVALLRNKYLGLLKGLEAKQWQMGHIVRLRTAGMEDVTIS